MLYELLNDLRNDIPNCLSVSVVNLEQGLPLITSGELDNGQGADAFHANLYGMVRYGLKEMGADSDIQSIVIESKQMKFVSTPLGDTGYFVHLVTRKSTTLGFIKAIVKKYVQPIITEINDLTVV